MLKFIPGFYCKIIGAHPAESLDERRSKPCVCNKGNVKVNGSPAHLESIRQLLVREVFRNIDNQTYLVFPDKVQSRCRIVSLLLVRPEGKFGLDSVFVEIAAGTARSVNFVSLVGEQTASRKKVRLLQRVA